MVRWFVQRADRILLLFDAHKLDISDEFKRVINVLKGNDDKVSFLSFSFLLFFLFFLKEDRSEWFLTKQTKFLHNN